MSKSYNFSDVQKALCEKEMMVEYDSLTSDNTHKKLCTIPKKIQRESDKILVWNVEDEKFIDIEVSTIKKIYEP